MRYLYSGRLFHDLSPVKPYTTFSARIVMAVFSVFELVGDMLVSWLPLYYEAKIVLIIWLSLPQTKGSERLYAQLIEPWLLKNESDIDAPTEIVSQHISDGVSHIRSASLGFIKNKSVEILTMVPLFIRL